MQEVADVDMRRLRAPRQIGMRVDMHERRPAHAGIAPQAVRIVMVLEDVGRRPTGRHASLSSPAILRRMRKLTTAVLAVLIATLTLTTTPLRADKRLFTDAFAPAEFAARRADAGREHGVADAFRLEAPGWINPKMNVVPVLGLVACPVRMIGGHLVGLRPHDDPVHVLHGPAGIHEFHRQPIE